MGLRAQASDEALLQFMARRERMLNRADARPILWAALGIVAFILWDFWLDAAALQFTVPIRLATAGLLLPLFWLQRARILQGKAGQWLHGVMFLIGAWGVTLAIVQVENGFLWGLPGVLMFPLTFAFYPLTSRVYLGFNLVGLGGIIVFVLAAGIPVAELVNFLLMYTLAALVGFTALGVLARQQLRLFLLEQKHAADARTDSLTGLWNRRFLEALCSRHVRAAERLHRPLSVLLLDLDHFKRINDEHGHDVGDEALQEAARVLEATLRSVDYVGRWGGEEFLAILIDTESEQAMQAAHRCIQAIDRIRLDLGAGRVLRMGTSVGAAQLAAGETYEAMIKRADEALYSAKQGGRGCARLAPPAGPVSTG